MIIPDWLRSRYHGESADPEKEPWPGLPMLQASNVDWEDIAIADGRLYIGNNGNARRDLGVYVVNEPNPRAIHSTKTYRLDTDYTDRENVHVPVDSHDQVTLASAADVSPDGRLLAVLTYTALWVFEKPASGDRWLSGRARRLDLDARETRQVEALCWDDGDTLLLANEQRDLYRVELSSLSPVE